MSTFSSANIVNNNIITKPYLISKEDLSKINNTTIGFNPDVAISLEDESVVNFKYGNPSSPKLLNYVEPYMIAGFQKTLFYTEVNTGLNVNDKVFIINGPYDSNALIKTNKYKKGRDGYKVLYIDNCRIVLDIDYVGDLPSSELNGDKPEVFDDFIKVYYINDANDFIHVNRQISTRNDSVDYKFNKHQNNIIYSKYYPGFDGWGKNNGLIVGTEGFYIKDNENWVSITSDFLTGSYSIAAATGSNNKILIVNGSFTASGIEFKEDSVYKYNTTEYAWEVDIKHENNNPAIITKSNFRDGIFNGKFNGGLYGSSEKRIKWESVSAEWNSGTLLNTVWKEGIMNSLYTQYTSYYAEFDAYDIPFQKVTNPDNNGYGYNFVINSEIQNAVINNGNVSNCLLGQGTYSIVEQYIKHSIDFGNFDSGITTNKALFDNCKFINANIENTEVRNSRSINSRFNNIKSVNSHYQTSVFTNSKFISDNIIKVLDYDAFKYSQSHTNSSLTQMVYKFYINKRSYEKFKIKDTFYIKGLKINDKSNSVLNFFDKKFKIGPWVEYTDDYVNGTTEYGKRGFEYSAFISTPEENKYTYNLNIANTQGNTITGLKDGEYYSVDIFVSYKDIDGYANINNFDNIDFSNAYIVNSDFESGIFENSVWNNGNNINYNNDVNISNTNKDGFYDLKFDTYNNQNNVIKANISLGKETEPGYLDINEIVFLNALDYDTNGKVTSYSIENKGANYYSSSIIELIGGSGFGMSMNIIAEPIGSVLSISYSYNNRNRYNPGVNTTTAVSGSGTGLTVNVTVDILSAITSIIIVNPGLGYKNGDVVKIDNHLLDVATFTITNSLQGGIKSSSTIVNPGIGYKVGDVLQIPQIPQNGAFATIKVTAITGTTIRIPDSYKIIEKTNNGNTIYLECLDDNVNIFQNLTGGRFSTLGAYNRYGYLHKAKFSKSVIQSGIFKRSFFKECTIGNEAYDVSDKDFKDLDNKRNLLIADTIFSNNLNTLSKATYMNSFVIGNGDKWINGILYNSIWNGMTFQSGLVKESNWLDGTFENGVFYNSKSFDYNLTAPTYDTLDNSYNSTYYTAQTLNNRYSWRNGVFNGGEFYKSDWEDGIFNKGKFYNSKFYKGVINGGFIGDINIGDTYVFNALINYTTVDNSKLVAMKYIKTQKSDILWVDGVFNSGEFGTDNQSNLNTAVWQYGIFNGGRFINNGRWENGIFNGGKFLSYYKWDENDNGVLLTDGSAVKYGLAIDTNSDKYSWVDGIFNGGEFGSGSSGPNSNWFGGEFNDGIFQGRIWNSGIFSYGKFTGSNTQTIIGGALNTDGTATPQYTNSNTALSNFTSGNYYGLWRSGYVTDLKDKYVDKKNYTTLKRASDTTKDNKRTLIENALWTGGTFDHTKAVMVNSIWLDGVFNNGTFTNSSFNPYITTSSEFNLNDGCIWNNGTFNGGDFYISKWNNGIFNSGTAIGMIWNNGTANYMNAYNVFWNNGLWRNGNWKGSDFYLEEDGTVKDNYTKQILFRGMSFSNTTYTHVWNIFKEEKMSVNKSPMITNGNLITSNPEDGTEDDTPPTAPTTFTSAIAGPPADTTPPTAPGSITVSEVTTNSGKLSWTSSTDSVGVTGYNIYQTGVGLIGTVPTLFFTVTGLSSNTPYTFTVTAIDNAGNESTGSNAGFTTLDDSLTISSSAPYYSYSDGTFVGIDSFSGNLDFAHGQPNEVISLLLILTSNTTPWSEVNFFDEEGILISQPLNASNTIRNGSITLDANGVGNGLYWGIGIPTCSCKITITGRSSGLPIPSANSTSFTIDRP
jgi:hypothetical protein